MKVIGCFAVLCLAVLAATFFVLVKLESIRPSELTGDPYVPPPPEQSGPSTHTFSSTGTSDRYQLHYGFTDYEDRRHLIDCSVSKADHKRETSSFGYRSEQIDAAIDALLQKWLNDEIAKRGLAPYYTLKTHGGGSYHWEYNLPGTLSVEESARLKNRIDDMNDMIKKDYQRKFEQTEDVVYRKYGFTVRNQMIQIDYGSLVIRGQQPLTGCFEAILRAAEGADVKKTVGLYLAFIQQIPYEKPPSMENGKQVTGFWPPTEVLVHDHGDCDSKSVAVSALLRSFGLPVILVEIPKPSHVLIGVEMRPGPQQEFVRLGNRYFVLCEAAGPARLRPGEEGFPVRGHFEYTLVEPDQRGVTANIEPATR